MLCDQMFVNVGGISPFLWSLLETLLKKVITAHITFLINLNWIQSILVDFDVILLHFCIIYKHI